MTTVAEANPDAERVAILGLGLMGASLGLALKRAGGVRVSGYARRAATCAEAVRLGVVDEATTDPGAAVRAAGLVVLCVPVLTIPELLGACVPHLTPGCLVTDVGSTKAALMADAAAHLRGRDALFIGSHPICGSDRTGLEAARDDLYDGAMVVVTPPPGAAAARVARVQRFWTQVGARVAVLTAEEHDRIMGCTSHLPHVVAAILVQTVCREGVAAARPFCGTGFRDTTRIAGGSEDIWHDIVKTNSCALSRELAAFDAVLQQVRGILARGDFEALREFLAEGRLLRQAMEGKDA